MRRTLCLAAASGAAALAAVGQASALWLPFDTLAHFTPQLLIAAVMLTAAAAWPRARLALVLMAVPVAMVAVGLWPTLAGSPPAHAVADERPVRVMSYNVWARNTSPDSAAATILAADPDVVVLVEMLPGLRGVLDRIASRYPYRATCPKPRCWLAVAAKHPFSLEGRKGLMPLVAARFGPELSGLTMVGVHLARPPAVGLQMRQLAEAAPVIADAAGPVIVAGDFNATPFSVVLRRFERETGLSGLTALPSWPSFVRLPQVAIDHIFVSPEITAAGVRLGEPGGSDHYPVIADLTLPPES